MKKPECGLAHPVIECTFESCGYPCAVLFQPLGHRCGYVGVPKAHPCYGKNYTEVEIDCHGGLTYADGQLFCSRRDDLWWFGFDCAHAGDAEDLGAMERYYPGSQELVVVLRTLRDCGVVRTVDFVMEQCAHIADQLKWMKAPPRPKPCPFCGASATRFDTDYSCGEIVDIIECVACSASVSTTRGKHAVIEKWNRRAGNETD